MTVKLALPFGPSFVPGNAVQGNALFFDDFIGSSIGAVDVSTWADVSNNGSAVLDDDVSNGVVLITSGALSGEDGVIELNGEPFILQTQRDFYFEARFNVDTILLAAPFLGLGAAGFDGGVGVATAAHIGFASIGTDANLIFTSADGTTQTSVDTGVDLVVGTSVVVAFKWNGNSQVVHAYVNGSLVANVNVVDDNLPLGDFMTAVLSLERVAGTGGTMSVDYVLFAADRD